LAQKIIIDADPGIGDALAIALALTDPEIDVVGITATAGSVSGKSATLNIQTIVEFLDPKNFRVWGYLKNPFLSANLKTRQGKSP